MSEENKRLTKKQRGFVKDYISTGIGSLAAKRNYDVANDQTARAIAHENLIKPHIVKSIADAIPDDLLAKVHLEGLSATKTFSSHTEPDKVEPDYATRHKYMDSGYKLKGSYAPEKHDTRTVSVDLTKKDLITKVAQEVIKKLQEHEE